MFRSRAHSIVAAHAGPRAGAPRAKTNSMRGGPRFEIRSFLHLRRQNLCQTRDRLGLLPLGGSVGPRTHTGGARSWPSPSGVRSRFPSVFRGVPESWVDGAGPWPPQGHTYKPPASLLDLADSSASPPVLIRARACCPSRCCGSLASSAPSLLVLLLPEHRC